MVFMPPPSAVPNFLKPSDLDCVVTLLREVVRKRGGSWRTEESYSGWVKRFAAAQAGRPPEDWSSREVAVFLSDLALREKVSAATQHQAQQALIFFFRHVLNRPLEEIKGVVRVPRVERRPVVLTPGEMKGVLDRLPEGPYRLLGNLLYGSGLRLLEALGLRAMDVEFDAKRLRVRDGRGREDRRVPLAEKTIPGLRAHLEEVRRLHTDDCRAGRGHVDTPDGITTREWKWQFVFPSKSFTEDPVTGRARRSHMHENSLQKVLTAAGRAAGIAKPVSPQALRHSCAVHLLDAGCDLRSVQKLLGHRHLTTTMAYARWRSPTPTVRSPLDTL